MPINNYGAAIGSVIEQIGLLERIFHESLEPNFVYRRAALRDPVAAHIGETITKSRPALLAPVTTDQNPSSNTGLDNGLTVQLQGFEQYQVTVNLTSGTMDVNLEMEETLIAPLYLEQWEKLAQQAGSSLDTRIAMELHQRYGGGNTYANTANGSSSTSLKVDNIYGFQTMFQTSVVTPSAGLPVPVSSTYKLPIKVIAASNGAVQTANVIGYTADVSNISTANNNGVVYGASGTLTLDAGVTCAVGDQVVALDGSYIIRPNGKTTRFALTSTDVVSLQQFISAKTKLVARQIPKFRNGCYVCIVDPFVMAQLYNDPQFIRATQGTWNTSPVFKNGVIAPALGLEFVESALIPSYILPNAPATAAGLVARRAIVIGSGCIVDAPFEGALIAARKGSGGLSVSDMRIVDDIVMVTRPSLDRYGQVVSQTWKWTGGRSVPTDVLSTPLVIPTSDYARYKRAVEIEVAG
jgi:hypothetical protein